MPTNVFGAHFDPTTNALVVTDLTLTDPDVVREARRWTSGGRGAVVDDTHELTAADLSAFVTESVRIGSLAFAAAGPAQEARALESMLKEVGDKAAESTAQAAELTGKVVREASATVVAASDTAKKALAEADERCRKEFRVAVSDATTQVRAELGRLFGGTDPEVFARLAPVLERFSADLDKRVTAGAQELISTATKQFDISDPSSPMAKHTTILRTQYEAMTQLVASNHAEITTKVDAMHTELRLREAKAAVVQVTTLKGTPFADAVHALMEPIATGLGDEYLDTSNVVGAVPRSRKGDGLLTTAYNTRVVLEMTDSARNGWGDYFDIAEQNRKAAAALGIVRTAEQNGGETIRVLGPRRLVLAFNPETDNPGLLRTAVMLLRAAALTTTSRTGVDQIATAEEKIQEAIHQLEKISEVKKTAGSIQRGAAKIEQSCTAITTSIERALSEALTALTASAASSAPPSRKSA